MLPTYEAWKSGDIAGAQAIVDREARQIQQWPAERDRMQAYVGVFYMTLGLLMLDTGHLYNLVALAEIRDDVPALRSYLSRMPPTIWVHRLVKAGLIEQARARLESQAADPSEQDIENIGRASLALATGSPETAIPLLRKVLPVGTHLSGAYQHGCELLATALARVNRRAEAITELERCATVRPRFFGDFNAFYWMNNELRLADEYRLAGRTTEAERIEQQLRRLLVYADADHPLVARLQKLPGR